MRKELCRQELIGKAVEVSGFSGKIIDETKHMITIQCSDRKTRKFIKKNHTFKINGEEIQGTKINARPEERVKKKLR